MNFGEEQRITGILRSYAPTDYSVHNTFLGNNTMSMVSDRAHELVESPAVGRPAKRKGRRNAPTLWLQERDTGIEPVFQAWEARVEPIN